jgi:hypothetical protein
MIEPRGRNTQNPLTVRLRPLTDGGFLLSPFIDRIATMTGKVRMTAIVFSQE